MNQRPAVHPVLRTYALRLFRFRKLAAGVLGICAVWAMFFLAPAYADDTPGDIRVAVSYGYNNMAKGGRYLPVEVTVTNENQQLFSGHVQVKSMESDGAVYLYEYELELEPGSQRIKRYYIPVGMRADQLYVKVTDTEGTVLHSQRLRLNISSDVSELFIGLLSDTPSRLSYLDGVGINYSALRTRLFSLNTETFPSEQTGLDSLDVILVTNYRLRDLSEEQTGAIMDWVSGGGVLILGTGSRVNDTLGRFAPELLDDSYGSPELIEVDMGLEYATDTPGEHILELTCVDIPLHGGNVIFSADELPLLTAATRGKGLVAVAAYDLVEIEDFCIRNPSYVDHLLTGLLGEDRIDQIAGVIYSGSSNKFWSVQNLINTGDVDRLPNLSLYVAVVVLYLFLIGPGLYLFLRRKRMQPYYRRGVLLISFGFAVAVYLLGSGTRFTGTFFNYASIQDATEDYVTETTYVNMRNPYNKPYRVTLDSSYSVLPITRSYNYNQGNAVKAYEEERYQVAIRKGPESTIVDVQDISAFVPKYFQMRKKTENTEKIGIYGDIVLYGDHVSGSITNYYDYPIENATILFYGKMMMLSAMEPGETRDLDGVAVINCPINYSYAIAEEITGGNRFTGTDIDNKDYLSAMERTNLLAFYMDNYMTSYNADARVIAFSSRKEEHGFLRDKHPETSGLTMLTSAIAVDSYDGDTLYRSTLMKSPAVISGSYTAATNSMTGMDPVTLEYSLGNDVHIESLYVETLSESFVEHSRGRYFVPFQGNIYFYNYSTGSFDLIGKTSVSYGAEELRSYLSPGNTLTVRYVYDGGGYSDVVLPVPTIIGREK